MDRLSTQNEWGSGELCVTFQFLDYPHLEICEKDFVSKIGDTPCTDTSFRSGKSCLFAIPNAQLESLPQEFEVNVGVMRKMPPGVLPDKLLLAQTKIELTEAIAGVIDDVTRNPQDVPVTKRVRDSFDLMEPTGLKVVGCIGVFVRLTCFGKLIVTPFHLGGACDGGSTAFFGGGGGEDKSDIYHCVEVGPGPKTGPGPCCQPPPCPWPCWGKPCEEPPCCDPPPCCKDLSPMAAPAATGAGGCCGGGGSNNPGDCLCVDEPCPPPSTPRRKPRPCKEIGAEINGHALTIRVVKNKDLEQSNMANNPDCCAISVPSSCPCSTKESTNPGGPGFFVQLPQKDGKPVSYRLRNCLADDTGGECLEQTDKPRDNVLLRIGKGKSHLELELQTPKKEGPRPLTDTLSRETQYCAAEAGPPINFYAGKRCRGKRKK